MNFVTKKYLRKPLIVEAIEVTADNFEAVAAWCQGEIVNNNGTPTDSVKPGGQHIALRVHQPKNVRQTKAFVGDWILYTDRGYKIYTPKAFHASFVEAAEPEGVKAATTAEIAQG